MIKRNEGGERGYEGGVMEEEYRGGSCEGVMMEKEKRKSDGEIEVRE